MTFELRLCPINKRTCRGSWNLVIMTLGYTSTNRTPIFLRKYYHRILKQDLSLRYIKAFIPRGSSLNFTFFFLSGFPFTTIHESQDYRGRPRVTTLYHFYLLYRHLLISQTITAESSPLHTGRSQTRTRNLWFPSANC